MSFLKENWPWIVVPAAIFLILIVAIAFLGGEGESPFIYGLFDG